MLGILCCAQQSVFEAFKATAPAFGFIGKGQGSLQPLVVVVVIVNNFKPQVLCESGAFVLADAVLALWINIWIAVKYGWTDVVF